MVGVSRWLVSSLNPSFLGIEASSFDMLDFPQSGGHLFYYFQRVNLQFCPRTERNSLRNKGVNVEVYLNRLLIKYEVFGSLRSIRWCHFFSLLEVCSLFQVLFWFSPILGCVSLILLSQLPYISLLSNLPDHLFFFFFFGLYGLCLSKFFAVILVVLQENVEAKIHAQLAVLKRKSAVKYSCSKMNFSLVIIT